METEKLFIGKTKKQWIITLSFILLLSLISMLQILFKFTDSTITIIGYQIDVNLLIKSSIIGLILPLALILASYFIIKYLKPQEKISTRNMIWAIILFICGLAAEIVLNLIFIFYAKLPALVFFPIDTFIVLIYTYLCYELCFLGHFDDPSRFFEIFRFALVGAISAIFDFSVTSLMRFVILKNLENAFAISTISVTCGFLVSVIINYLCSITMVFKNSTDKNISKTSKGVILFVFLSAIGLFMGMGLEVIFFDLLSLPEPVCFIIRTLIVLIWNYVSRKLFIFK